MSIFGKFNKPDHHPSTKQEKPPVDPARVAAEMGATATLPEDTSPTKGEADGQMVSRRAIWDSKGFKEMFPEESSQLEGESKE